MAPRRPTERPGKIWVVDDHPSGSPLERWAYQHRGALQIVALVGITLSVAVGAWVAWTGERTLAFGCVGGIAGFGAMLISLRGLHDPGPPTSPGRRRRR